VLGEYGAPRCANEGGDLCEVLSTRGTFDTAGDVDHPGSDPADSNSDVLWSQTAGQDQVVQGGYTIEKLFGNGDAGAAGLAGDVSVDQDRVRWAPESPGTAEVLVQSTPGRGHIQAKRPDDPQVVKREQVFRRLSPVQLDDLQAELFRDLRHQGGGPVDEHAHSPNRGWERGDYLGGFRWLYVPPRSGMKVEADPIRAGLRARERFIDARQTADLNADHGPAYSEGIRNCARREENEHRTMRLP